MEEFDDDCDDVTFEVTDDHLKFLRAGCFVYNGRTANMAMASGRGDDTFLARALGLDPDDVTPRHMRQIKNTFEGTQRALEVVLATGAFEAGTYRRRDAYVIMSWERIVSP